MGRESFPVFVFIYGVLQGDVFVVRYFYIC